MVGSGRTKQGQPRIVQRQVRKRLTVNELTLGMYVVELDRPWQGSPFLFQGFVIETDADLQQVRDLCHWVIVEAVEELQVDAHGHALIAKPATTRFVEKRDIAKELTEANRTYQATKLLVKNIFASAHLGNSFSLEEAQTVVKECADRVISNPNAILWLTRLKNQDSYTAEHSVNVCILAISLGRVAGLNAAELENLGICALMHDIGKMKVPDHILNKPGRLDPEEFREMARHTIYAKQLLMGRTDIYPGAVDVAYSHHERIDGKGYPRNIDGAKISQFTRIVSIVDAYDAMTSDRCYKPGMSSLDAMRVLHKNRHEQFDAELVDQFIALIGLYPPGYLMEMSNGEVGIILSSDPGFQLKPNVIMILDKDKNPQPERIINLAHKPSDNAGRAYEPKGVYRSGAFGISVSDYINRGLRIKGFEYGLSN